MPSLFTKIVNGDIPCNKIAEDDRFLAFLDIRPIKPGHTLVIPKQEIDYIFDIDDTLLGDMMVFAKRIAQALKAAVPCKRVGIMVAGLEVPHAHIHLVPMHAVSDLNFSNAAAADPDVLADTAEAIRRQL